MRMLFLLTAINFMLFSCGKEETPAEVDARNDQEILDYLADNNITDAIKTESGLYVKIDEEGSTEKPTPTTEVTVTYEGFFVDGERFDGTSTPIKFFLNGVIEGWTEGIPYFGRGGSGSLYIPAKLAYGYSDFRSIPGGSTLIFDVELIDF